MPPACAAAFQCPGGRGDVHGLLRPAAFLVALAVAGCAAQPRPPVAAAAPFVDPPMTPASSASQTPEQQRTLLAPYRARLDVLDDQIVALLGKRFDIIREVAELKAEHGIAPIQPDRIEEVVARARAKAEHAGVDPKLVEQIYRYMIDEACKLEADYAHKVTPAPAK